MIKRILKALLRRLLEWGQLLGVSITPNHYYSEIPDLRELRRTTEWRRPSSLTGIGGTDLDQQLAFVRDCADSCHERLAEGSIIENARCRQDEQGFGPAEAVLLFAFTRRWQPPRILQIGCGVSTAVIEMAIEDQAFQPLLTCIEPAPSRYLVESAELGRLQLLTSEVQKVDLEEFTSLESGDFLFVDSTHTLRPGSDVNRIILEVLPRLAGGVWVHFHDIYFPYDYSPTILGHDLFFRHESVLLQGFLSCNPRFEIKACLSMLHHQRSDDLRQALPGFDPCPMRDGLKVGNGHYPSSIYLRVNPRESLGNR